MRKEVLRHLAAAVFAAAGLLWLVLVPEGPELRWDLVASLALGSGLLGTAALLLGARRIGPLPTLLAALLLWSLVLNATLLAWNRDAGQRLLGIEAAERPTTPDDRR